MALTVTDPEKIYFRYKTGKMADEMDTSRYMPPFTTHICCEPTCANARGDWVVPHSVPPFYVPIPEQSIEVEVVPTLAQNGLPLSEESLSDVQLIFNKVVSLMLQIWVYLTVQLQTVQTTTHKKSNRVLHQLGWAAAWGMCLFLLFLAYGNLPNRWYHVLYLYSGSMAPTLKAGDLIIITPPTRDIEPGMILTLRVDGQLVTHRLIAIDSQGSLITKGDANNAVDGWDREKVEIGGIVRARIPFLGHLAQFARIFDQNAAGSWFIDADSIQFDFSSSSWVIEPPVEPEYSGTSIQAEISVDSICAHSNGVISSGNPACANPPISDPGVTFEEMDQNAFGTLLIENVGSVDTSNLTIAFQVQYKTQAEPYGDLEGASFVYSPIEPIPAGGKQYFHFRVGFRPLADVQQYRLVAHVTINNHSGCMTGDNHCPGSDPCPFGPDPKAAFIVGEDHGDEYELGEIILLLQTPELTFTPEPELLLPTPTPDPEMILITESPPLYIPSEIPIDMQSSEEQTEIINP